MTNQQIFDAPPPDVPSADVVVVGARCAGAATALLLARQGHDVVVVDRAQLPSDTLSTHALARGGVVQLTRWGLVDAVVASGTPEIRSVRFWSPDGTVVRKTVKDRAGIDFLLAPRRQVLDQILLDAAIAAGARFEGGLRVTGTRVDATGRVVGVSARDHRNQPQELRARFVVGADGLRSRVSRSVGAATISARPSGTATHYLYVTGLDADSFEFHLGRRTFAGVFPTHGGEANVWLCTPAEALGGHVTPDDFVAFLDAAVPALAARVRNAAVTSPVRGAARLPNQIRMSVGRGWALAGDAAYHRDPITGHGMTDAFRDAELLSRALGQALRGEADESDALRAYADDRLRALMPIFDLTCRLAALPPASEFIALQKQLSARIDEEAAWLASLPELPCRDLAAA